MDVDFVEIPKVLHPGQGQSVFLDQATKIQWIIRPHICLADIVPRPAAELNDLAVTVCRHPNGGRFVQVSPTWLSEALECDADAIWRANVTGDLRLTVSPIAQDLPHARLKLDFSLHDRTASVEVSLMHRTR
jgi:hypothetical protein